MVVRHIHRDEFLPEAVRGTLAGGVMDDTGVVLQTLEDPIDLIPTGEFTARRSWYYRGDYECFEILVPGRSRILFHKGNDEDDTEGCVLLGTTRGVLGGKPAVLGSAMAFGTFMELLDGVDEFTLVITDE